MKYKHILGLCLIAVFLLSCASGPAAYKKRKKRPKNKKKCDCPSFGDASKVRGESSYFLS